MRTLHVVLVIFALAGAGCAYHNPTEPAPIVTPANTTPASIRLVASSRTDYTTAVIATVLTADGRFVASIPIAFTTAAGTVSPTDTTTDLAGSATAIVSTPTSALVSARIGTGLSASIQVAGAMAPLPLPPNTPPPAPPPIPPQPSPQPPPPPPPPTITLAAMSTTAGTRITLSVGPFLSDGTPIRSTAWIFGDGEMATVQTYLVNHTYTTVGTYTVTATAIDALGRHISARATVSVYPAPTLAAFSASLACAQATTSGPVACTVTGLAYGVPLPSALITKVEWDYGDGTLKTTAVPVASYTYQAAGTYTIFATVTANVTTPPSATTATATLTVK